MKLALTQIIFGIFIAIICLYVQIEGLPLEFQCPCPDVNGIKTAEVMINPGPALVTAKVLNVVAIFIGLGISGCGVVEFRKAQRSR